MVEPATEFALEAVVGRLEELRPWHAVGEIVGPGKAVFRVGIVLVAGP